LTGTLILTGGLCLAGCNSQQGFSRQAYCAALQASTDLDTKQLVDGDPDQLAKAEETYLHLQSLAPPQLADEWALVVAGLDAMLEAARGGRPINQTDHTAFSAALGLIDMDRLERCPE